MSDRIQQQIRSVRTLSGSLQLTTRHCLALSMYNSIHWSIKVQLMCSPICLPGAQTQSHALVRKNMMLTNCQNYEPFVWAQKFLTIAGDTLADQISYSGEFKMLLVFVRTCSMQQQTKSSFQEQHGIIMSMPCSISRMGV
jgi:hypothetical protein